MVKLGGTKMDEPARYRVIVDRISHEVEYYRGAMKHAVLQGTYVINNPFWWTADDKYFNYSVMAKLGVAIPRTVLLPQKGYPADIDLTAESLHNLVYPIDWDALLDYVGRPAILKPYSGGGWKHVYKVADKRELLEAYDRHGAVLHDAAAVHRLRSLRALLHVRQDRHHAGGLRPARAPVSRRARVPVGGASARASSATRRRINLALGYEMNTIEFADQGRRALRDRLPQPGAGLRARSHHRRSTSRTSWRRWRTSSSTAR